MRRSTLCLRLSALVLVSIGGFAACETEESSGGGGFTPPDSSFFDAPSSSIDATDTADVAEASAPDADARDASDAADAAVDTYPGIIGSASTLEYADRCPAGQFMIGVEGGAVANGFYVGILSKIRTLCGIPKVPVGASTEVTIDAGKTVPADIVDARGTVTPMAGVTSVSCPANQVVIGLSGGSRIANFPPEIPLTTAVQLHCAPLSWVNNAVGVGVSEVGGAIGAGGTAAGPFVCGVGSVVVGTRLYAGDVLNGIEPRCEPAVIP